MTDPKEPSEEREVWFVHWDNSRSGERPRPHRSGPYESAVAAGHEYAGLLAMGVERVEVVRYVPDAAQFRRGVEAAIAIVERDLAKGDYSAWKALDDVLTELRNLRGDDDG